MFLFILIFVVFVSDVPECNCRDYSVVQTSLGEVVGNIQLSYNGKSFASFEGVPYAKPPIGDLRFRDALPVESWNDPVRALTPITCLQLNFPYESLAGSEDCLYLNIYVPNTSPNSSTKYDVLVHIPAGMFMFSSGSAYASPLYLIDKEIILVTMNFRVGMFGFLSTEDSTSPGNYGLTDQILALKWIKEHIKSFGGNPDSITISGLASGGSSVQFHYLSPLSKDLFHKGISFSGAALNSFAFQKEPLEKAKQLGVFTNCPVNDTENLIDCLRKYPAIDLVQTIKKFNRIKYLPLDPFGPVIDGKFLPEHPYKLLKDKKVNKAPWLASAVRKEAILFGLPLKSTIRKINTNYDYYLSLILDYNYTVPESRISEVGDQIKKRYLNGKKMFDPRLLNQLYTVMTDRLFHVDIENAVRLHASAVKTPIYFYYYNWKGQYSFTQFITNDNKVYDIALGDDMLMIFTLKLIRSPVTPLNGIETAMKNNLLDLITNFMKTGTAKFNGIEFQRINREEDSDFVYLEINSPDNAKVKSVKNFSPREFWNGLGIEENANLF